MFSHKYLLICNILLFSFYTALIISSHPGMKTTAHTPLAARNRSVSPAGTRSMASYLDDRRPQTALQAKLAATITGGSRSVQLQRNLAQLFASPVQTKMPEEESL